MTQPAAQETQQCYQSHIVELEHHIAQPHALLGNHPHPHTRDRSIIRVWRPGASVVFIDIAGKITPMSMVHPAGLFSLEVDSPAGATDYRVFHNSGLNAKDPYAMLPSIGEIDLFLFNKGVHYRLWEMLGANKIIHDNCEGIRFAVWAPNAQRVALVADFNHWDGRANPMRSLGSSGIWELFVPGLEEGEKYKFEIRDTQGKLLLKSDPFAFSSEMRPSTASKVADLNHHNWTDNQWMQKRYEQRHHAKPMAIYEVHLGSWRQHEGNFLNYRDIAVQLADYCKEMGFTHVELLPIQEHPLDESWGYQVTGYYAVTSRFGSPQDFQWFVDHLHNQGIGVLLDWVPGHFPTDDFSLSRFDGTALYEHADPRLGFHPHWNTFIFNFGRHEVANFLLANALYWFDRFHVDGLRVDAVASMLYLDYGREPGEWIPNQYGGKENIDAIEFLKHLNSIVHDRYPGVTMIAEESTSFTGVTHPVDRGGLGFDLKWNMGWMNDTLRYFHRDMLYRSYHHNDLTFGMLYAYSERFALVLSHDEVVHGKGSLISKMPGDLWQRFANLRLLYSYMMCQPGKKLLFMGGEIAQWNEWYCKRQIEWDLLHFPYHSGVQRLVKELNHFYQQHSQMWERDHEWTGFEWIDFSDVQNSVICYLRKSNMGSLLCVHNFTPNYHGNYFVKMPNVRYVEELFNTDAARYGGADNINHLPRLCYDHNSGYCHGVEIVLAPLATMIFTVGF